MQEREAAIGALFGPGVIHCYTEVVPKAWYWRRVSWQRVVYSFVVSFVAAQAVIQLLARMGTHDRTPSYVAFIISWVVLLWLAVEVK